MCVGFVLALTACGAQYTDQPEESVEPDVPEVPEKPDVPDVPDVPKGDDALVQGADLYQAQCESCHGVLGDGEPNGSSILNSLLTPELAIQKIAFTMPIGNPAHCDMNCAESIVAWLIDENNLSSGSGSGSSTNLSPLEQVRLESPDQTFRRASLLLTGKIPTAQKLRSLLYVSDNKLRNEILALMKGSEFKEFLKTGANDRLQVRGLDTGATYQLLVEYYTNISTLNTMYSDEGYSDYRKSIREEPLELIAHVVMNDKPYSEILTADYTMVDDALNVLYRSNLDVEIGEWQPGRNTNQAVRRDTTRLRGNDRKISINHAGILSSIAMNNRWPSTATNRNRARAKFVLYHFLGFDIEATGSRDFTEEELADTNNPTMNNPACTQCHMTLDPIAGAFQNVGREGIHFDRIGSSGKDSLDKEYVDSALYSDGDRWYSDMFSPGYYQQELPDQDNSLPWLAEQIANDERFNAATVKFWWPAVFGEEFLNEDLTSQQLVERDKTLSELSKAFKNSDQNVKSLLADMLMTPWFRATEKDTKVALEDVVYYTGGTRLLTPEEISKKLVDITGINYLEGYRTNYNLFYGGIDSAGTTERARTYDPMMAQVAKRLALEYSCSIVAEEFNQPINNRQLFSEFQRDLLYLNDQDHDALKSQYRTYQSESDVLSVSITGGTDYGINIHNSSRRPVLIEQAVIKDKNGNALKTLTAADIEGMADSGEFYKADENKFTGENDARELAAGKKVIFTYALPTNATTVEVYSSRPAGNGLNRYVELSVYAQSSQSLVSPSSSTVRAQLAILIERFLGHDVAENGPLVNRYFKLFHDAREGIVSRGPSGRFVDDDQYCKFENANDLEKSVWAADPNTTLAAWRVVVAALMSQYEFLYE